MGEYDGTDGGTEYELRKRLAEAEAKLAEAHKETEAAQSANRKHVEDCAKCPHIAEIAGLEAELERLRPNHNLTEQGTNHKHALCSCRVPPTSHCHWCGAKMEVIQLWTGPARNTFIPPHRAPPADPKGGA